MLLLFLAGALGASPPTARSVLAAVGLRGAALERLASAAPDAAALGERLSALADAGVRSETAGKLLRRQPRALGWLLARPPAPLLSALRDELHTDVDALLAAEPALLSLDVPRLRQAHTSLVVSGRACVHA